MHTDSHGRLHTTTTLQCGIVQLRCMHSVYCSGLVRTHGVALSASGLPADVTATRFLMIRCDHTVKHGTARATVCSIHMMTCLQHC
jgi:hypothetical protein